MIKFYDLIGFRQTFGADEVINVKDVDPVEQIKKLTGGSGPGIVFECTGNHRALQTMVDILPFSGQGVIVSAYEDLSEIDFNTIMAKNLDLQGVMGYDIYFPLGIELIKSGQVKVDSLYSSIMPLEKVNEAMNSLLEGTEVGVIIEQ